MAGHGFFGRAGELGRLDLLLEAALAGGGGIALVAGEAGSGKTALVDAFAAGARGRRPDLVVAKGECSALGGLGDPYLPFREALTALTAAEPAEGPAAPGAPGGLRRFFSRSAEVLVEVAPDLIGTIIPGASLVATVGQAVAEKTGLMDEVRRFGSGGEGRGGAIEPGRIHEQVANLLRALAAERPIVLVVEDLHWADDASASLLFHLFRRLRDARVLLVATFRPDEVERAADQERHPVEKVVAEVKRYAGDVIVDLAEAGEAERRDFVDRLIDGEPNALDGEFRRRLLERTGGHPLFVVELLRDLQERGQLTRDAAGAWRAGAIDWTALPARVEGVVEERLGRLDREEREVLDVASVEGPTFSAEVVAQAAGLPLGPLARTLSRRLDRRHRLVREREAGGALSGYAFGHALIQGYLYGELGRAQRRVLHGEVARAQERLGGGDAEAAPRLAWHYDMAGEAEAAARHYLAAGERAARQGAPQEALAALDRALALLPAGDGDGRWRATARRARVLEVLGEVSAWRAGVDALVDLAEAGGDPGRLAEAWQLRARFLLVTITSRAVAEAAKEAADRAVAAAEGARRDDLLAIALASRALSLTRLGEVEAAGTAMEEALAASEGASDIAIRIRAQRTAMVVWGEAGDLGRCLHHTELGIELAREGDDPVSESMLQDGLGYTCIQLGRYEEAEATLRTSLRLSQRIGYRRGRGYALQNLALALLHLGDVAGAEAMVAASLAEFADTGDAYGQGVSHLYLGYVHEAAGRAERAAGAFVEAQDALERMVAHALATDAAAGRARSDLALGHLADAAARGGAVWAYLGEHGGTSLDNPARAYLTCADTFAALGRDDDARAIIAAGARELAARADLISDEALRRSFLEQVPDNEALAQRGRGLA